MTTLTSDLQNLNQTSSFVELYTLDLTSIGGDVYHYTNYIGATGENVSFGGTQYVALPIKCDGWDYVSTGQSPKPTLTVSNVSKTLLNAVVSLGDIVGGKVIRYRTFAKHLDITTERKNLLTWSDNFSNDRSSGKPSIWEFEWGSVEMTLPTWHLSTMLSPNPSYFADKIMEAAPPVEAPTMALNHFVHQSINTLGTTVAQNGVARSWSNVVSPAGVYTYSVYLKQAERRYAYVSIFSDGVLPSPDHGSFVYAPHSSYSIVVDLQTGSFTAENKYDHPYTSAHPANTAYSITDAGNGWYRISVTAHHTSGYLFGVFGTTTSATPAFNTYSYLNEMPGHVGDPTKGIYVWGAQLELSSTPTEYQSTSIFDQNVPDGSKFIGPDVFLIEQKVAHNKNFISWQLTSKMDRMGIKLPRRQVLKDRGFPGVSRTRIR